MHDPHHFPEVQEQLVQVQGLVVSESMRSLVQLGWMVAVPYVVLLTANFGYFLALGMPARAVVLSVVELVVLASLLRGMHQWRFTPALLICLHPVISIAFHGAGLAGLPLLGGTLGYVQASATILIVALVGQAAKSIHLARSVNASQAHDSLSS